MDYDVLVDWNKRLDREAPFFRAVFDEAGAKSVADVGAGTGRHAIMFAGWGLRTYAIDPDPAMLEQARANAATAGADVTILAGAFGGVAGVLPEPVDAVTCTGNALPHVEGRRGLQLALADFAAALRPGGALVIHMLNHQRLLDSRIRAIPPVVRETPEGSLAFLRFLFYDEPGVIGFDFVTLRRAAPGEWEVAEASHGSHTELPPVVLVDELDHAGFERIHLFGDHARKPFDGETDESVIVLAFRR